MTYLGDNHGVFLLLDPALAFGLLVLLHQGAVAELARLHGVFALVVGAFKETRGEACLSVSTSGKAFDGSPLSQSAWKV